MSLRDVCKAAIFGVVIYASPAAAQETDTISDIAVSESGSDTEQKANNAILVTPPQASTDTEKPCELHIWPTENYLGVQSGLLAGLGPIGAVANEKTNKSKVTTIKDRMREYLGPEIQLSILNSLNAPKLLALSEDYRIVVQPPTPWNEDLKDNPDLQAKVKDMNGKLQAGERLSDSQNVCYAELMGAHIFYHKAMFYGSNLYVGWQYRKFEGDKIVDARGGQVKSPLEVFPPKSQEMVETAKEELRDAYAKDFMEFTQKKIKKRSKRSERR